MKELEDAELRHFEGPCWDAYQHVQHIVAADLREEDDRWPNTASQAVGIGLVAAYAFPLRLRDTCIGALNLYRAEPGAFDDEDIAVAQAFADIAAIGILQEHRATETERLAGQLQTALDSGADRTGQGRRPRAPRRRPRRRVQRAAAQGTEQQPHAA